MSQAKLHTKPTSHPLIDTHGHYVFGVDDGAASLDMAVEMVRMAQAQGVTDIICTSHDQARRECYLPNLAALTDRLQQEGILVRLYPGCEIYCTQYTFPTILEQLHQGQLPPMGNSKYVLLEFHPYVEPGDLLYFVNQVRKQTEFLPIVAHIERYFILQEEPAALDVLRQWEIPVQINAYSLVEEHDDRIRGFARKVLAEQRVTFIGSDAHRTTHRPPKVTKGMEYIYRTCDEAYARAVCYENARRLLLG